jgi:nuclease S1
LFSVLPVRSTEQKRLTALKYVVHLVADIHQPLHAGYAEDYGGNRYQLQAFMRGSNLHALWDVGLIKNLDLSNEALTAKLLPQSVRVGDFNGAATAEESCRIVGAPGFYPDRKVDVPYIERFTPLMEQRLATAGRGWRRY